MIDLSYIEHYQEAKPVVWSFKDRLLFFSQALVDTIKILPSCIWISLTSLMEFFVGRKAKDIRGWTVLVTGGAHGIGKELCEEFSKAGCSVAVADVDEKGAKLTVKELIEKYSVKAVAYKVDVSDYQRVQKLKEEIERDIGPVDILVNNAAVLPLLSLRGGSKDDIDKIVAVNFTAQFYTTSLFLNGMLKRKRGHIVTMASQLVQYAGPGACLYTSTKHGIHGFALALEEELRVEGHGNYIKFTTVYPYFVASRKELFDAVNLTIPPVSPDEVAKRTINGVLKNYRTVYVPNWIKNLTSVFNALPYEALSLFKDKVVKQDKIRLIKYHEVYSKVNNK